MNPYEAKQERRRERLEARADKLRREGESRISQARKMADVIPFGQPILVGHHSEGRDRRYRAKIHNNFSKGFETLKAADEVAGHAASVGTGGISSDDPEAVQKLKAELAPIEAKQAQMVQVNKLVRKGDRDGLKALGHPQALIDAWFAPGQYGGMGYASFQLTNNSANIRRIKQRIEQLQRHATQETTEREINGVRVVENAEANRLQLFFPGKPAEAVRTHLKRSGFRWSPMEGAWQRHLSGVHKTYADYILAEIAKLGEPAQNLNT